VRSVTTGEGRSEYVPVGHSTGIAARMQAMAPVGSIAATEPIRVSGPLGRNYSVLTIREIRSLLEGRLIAYPSQIPASLDKD